MPTQWRAIVARRWSAFPPLARATIVGAAGLTTLRLIRALRTTFGYDLRGKVVVLTGGTRGLGYLLAREFIRAGARVAICARDEDELRTVRDELRRMGAEVLALQCDVSSRYEVERFVRDVERDLAAIDVLVNVAGIITAGPALVQTIEDYEVVLAINFWGGVYATYAALPGMLAKGEGRIVNITSIGGKVSVPHLLPYASAKFASVGFSEGMRAELASKGIVVTTVVPGLMRTGSYINTFIKGDHRKEFGVFALLDSLPISSMSAHRAARQIVAATRRGDAEVILSWQAQVAARVHGLFPGLTANALAVVARFLPERDQQSSQRWTGAESESALTRSPLTALNQRAADETNQRIPQSRDTSEAAESASEAR